jgi:PPOX class probable F420-dependent enzyme
MLIPEESLDFFDKPAIGHIATSMPDGSPHCVPTWVGYDGEHVLTAGACAHRRHRNLERDPRVALTMIDPDDPYRSLLIRGVAVQLDPAGAMPFIDAMARLHWGVAYPFDRHVPRYLVRIRPDVVVEHRSRVPDGVE